MTAAAPATMKGSGFNSFIAATKATLSATELAAVTAALPASTAALLHHPPLTVAQVPIADYLAFSEALIEHGFAGDDRRMRDIARIQLRNDLNGIYRLFIRLASPDFIIERAGQVYATYWRNNGHLRAEKIAPTTCHVIYEEVVGAKSYFWQAQCGAIQSALEACGAKNVSVEIDHASATAARMVAKWT